MKENFIKFAPKIFSNDSLELQKSVLNLLKPHYGLEVAFYDYKEFGDEVKTKIANLPSKQKIIHLWQSRVCLKGIKDNLPICVDSWNYELTKAKELNIDKAVIHNDFKSTPLGIVDENKIKEYAQQVAPVLKMSCESGLKLHIENTFEDVRFFHIFFNELKSMGYHIYAGFCLDTGHTRAMTKNSLNDWFELIKMLVGMGISMHYHIHVNDGTYDSHTTLCEGEQRGMLAPIEGWSEEGGFLYFFNKLTKLTPEAIFCQEHSSMDALEAMSFIDILVDDGVFN